MSPVSASLADNRDFTGSLHLMLYLDWGEPKRMRTNMGPTFPNKGLCVWGVGIWTLVSDQSIKGECVNKSPPLFTRTTHKTEECVWAGL